MKNSASTIETRPREGQYCKIKANILLSELEVSKKAYASFIQADIYPHARSYFEKSYRQRTAFFTILRDEFNILGLERGKPSARLAEPIFGPMERQVLEGNLTDRQLDALIMQKEQELLVLYQEFLAYELPNVTLALIQSQAEELNNGLQGLKTELRI